MASNFQNLLLRRGSLAEFNCANPILASGEPAFAIDTHTLKIGNGINTWLELESFVSSYELKKAVVTINIPAIAINQSVTIPVNVNNINSNNKYAILVSPETSLPDGIIIAYAYASDTDEVSIVLRNTSIDFIDGGNANDGGSAQASQALNDVNLYLMAYLVSGTTTTTTTTTTPEPIVHNIQAFGYNAFGQLGTNDNVNHKEPYQVYGNNLWRSFDAGTYHALAIDFYNDLYAFGFDYYGQLGDGNSGTGKNQKIPIKITDSYIGNNIYSSGSKWAKASAGANHSLAIDDKKRLFSFGSNAFGSLGLGDVDLRTKPTMVGDNINYIQLDPYTENEINIIDNVFTFSGINNNYSGIIKYLIPNGSYIISGVPEQNAIAILNSGLNHITYSGENFAGSSILTGTTADGAYNFYYGNIYINVSGNFGSVSLHSESGGYMGGEDLFYYQDPNTQWENLAIGQHHSVGIKNGELYTFGQNSFGQLGVGDNNTRLSPVKIGSKSDWIAVAAANYHSLALDSSGNLYSFGKNDFGQLGLGDYNHRNIPVKVSGLWTSISAGNDFSVAIDTNNKLWSFGKNNHGQLGLGDTANRNIPTKISVDNWHKVSAGSEHVLAISDAKRLWTFGKNNYGQLGTGDTTNRSEPYEILGNIRWSNASAGGDHSLASIYSYYPTPPIDIIVKNALASINVGTQQLELSWTHNAIYEQGITNFKIQVSGDNITPFFVVKPSSIQTSYIVDNLVNNSGYRFRIASVNSVGEIYSDWTLPAYPYESVDPDFCSYVKLLSHFNGADDSTTFLDSSKYEWEGSGVGTARLTTDHYKFGESSAMLDNGGAIIFGSGNNLNLTGNFTIECFVKPACWSNTEQIILNGNKYKHIDSASSGWAISVENGTVAIKHNLGGSTVTLLTSNTTIPLHQWSHIAWARSGTTNSLYINGLKRSSDTILPSVYTYNDTTVDVGATVSGNILSSQFWGYVDELRISENIRYSGAYTIPFIPFGSQVCPGTTTTTTTTTTTPEPSLYPPIIRSTTDKGYVIINVNSHPVYVDVESSGTGDSNWSAVTNDLYISASGYSKTGYAFPVVKNVKNKARSSLTSVNYTPWSSGYSYPNYSNILPPSGLTSNETYSSLTNNNNFPVKLIIDFKRENSSGIPEAYNVYPLTVPALSGYQTNSSFLNSVYSWTATFYKQGSSNNQLSVASSGIIIG